MGGGTSREPGFEGQQGWTAGIPQDWEKQKLHSGRLHGRSYAHEGPVKKTNRPTYLLVLEGLLWRWGAAVADGGDKDIEGGRSGE